MPRSIYASGTSYVDDRLEIQNVPLYPHQGYVEGGRLLPKSFIGTSKNARL
jgi:hypothetical protein